MASISCTSVFYPFLSYLPRSLVSPYLSCLHSLSYLYCLVCLQIPPHHHHSSLVSSPYFTLLFYPNVLCHALQLFFTGTSSPHPVKMNTGSDRSGAKMGGEMRLKMGRQMGVNVSPPPAAPTSSHPPAAPVSQKQTPPPPCSYWSPRSRSGSDTTPSF